MAEPEPEPEPEPDVSLLVFCPLHSQQTHRTHWKVRAHWAELPRSVPKALNVPDLVRVCYSQCQCLLLHDARKETVVSALVSETKTKSSH